MHHSFRNVSIIIWDGKGGKRGGVLSNPNNFLADFFTLLRSTQFGNFPLKINYTVSMGDFEIFNFTEHQKHFLCIFKFVQFVQLTSIFLLKLEKWKYGSDECWKGTISSDQSCGFYVEVLGTHKLFQINSNFCPLILPCVLPSSIFAQYFALIFCPCPCPLQKRGQGQEMRAKYRANVEEGKKEGKTRYY